MKKSKWMLLLLVFALVMVPMLQACSNGGTDEAATDNTTGNDTGGTVENGDAENEGTENGAAEAPEGAVELSMTAWGNPEEFNVYQRAVDLFNEQHDDITVELTPTPGDNYEQTLITRLQGGEAPDVFYVGAETISTLIENGTIVSLNDFLDGPDSYVTADEFAEGLWGAARKDGEIYGLTVDNNPMVMYYNKDLFEETGVQTPQEYFDEGNWTWDAMEEITSQLRDAGYYGFVADAGFNHMASWVWSNGGELYDGEGGVLIDQDPQTAETFEFLSRMVEEENFTFSGTLPQGQGTEAMFMSNQVGMVAAGRWFVPLFAAEETLDFDIIPWPTNTGNEQEPAAIATAYLSVNANTDHQEAAMKFASFYTSVEGQEVRLSGTGNAVPSVAGLDEVVTGDEIPEHSQYLIDAREIGFASDFETTIPGLTSELTDVYELMFIGEVDAASTIEEAARVARDMIESAE